MSRDDALLRRAHKKKRIKRRRPWRRLFLLAVFLLLAGLLASLPSLLSTQRGQRWLQRTLASHVPGDMDFQKLTLSWRRGLTVEGFHWQDANDASRIVIARLSTHPRFLPFFKGEISLGTLVMEQPQVYLDGSMVSRRAPPSGSEDGEGSGAPAPSGSSRWRLRDMRLIIKDGRFRVEEGAAGTTWEDIHLDLQVPRTGPGRLHFAATVGDPGQTGSVTLTADAARPFEGARLTGNLRLELESLDLQSLQPLLSLMGRTEVLHGDVDGTLSARMHGGTLTQGTVQLQGRTLQVAGPALKMDTLTSATAALSARLTEQGDQLLAQVEFQSDGMDIRIDGACPVAGLTRAAVLESPWMGEVNVDLAVLARQLRHTLRLREGVDVTAGRLAGTLQLADGWVQGDLQLADLHGTYAERALHLSDTIHVSTRSRWSQGGIQVEDFRIQSPFATGTAMGDLKQMEYELEVNLERLQGELGAFLDLGTRSWEGTATARASLQREDPQWVWHGSAELRDLRVSDPNGDEVVEPHIQVQHRLTYDPGQAVCTVEQLNLDTGPLTLQDSVFRRVATPGEVSMTGRTRCGYDWHAVRPWLMSLLPEGLDLRGKREDMLSFSSTYPAGQSPAILSGLTAHAKLGFEHASYQGLEIGPTDVNFTVQRGRLALAPFVSTVNEGQLRFGCWTDLTRRPRTITLSEPMPILRGIHLTGPLANNLLKYLNPIFANLADISGRLDFESQELVWPVAAESREQLVVIGSIAMRDVHLEGSALLSQILALFDLEPARGQRLAVRPTAFTVRNGVVRYEDMQIDIGDNPLNFSGVIGLDDSLDMTITLPYTWSGRTARVDRPSGDRIQLPLTGSLSEPRLDTERFLKDQLRQQLEKQIHKGLEELFERL